MVLFSDKICPSSQQSGVISWHSSPINWHNEKPHLSYYPCSVSYVCENSYLSFIKLDMAA